MPSREEGEKNQLANSYCSVASFLPVPTKFKRMEKTPKEVLRLLPCQKHHPAIWLVPLAGAMDSWKAG